MSEQEYVLTEGGRGRQAVPTATASKSESSDEGKKRTPKRRTDTIFVFDPAQKVPDHVLKAIIDEWLVPCLVEEFSRKRDGPLCSGAEG
jgi:hypothetical protein